MQLEHQRHRRPRDGHRGTSPRSRRRRITRADGRHHRPRRSCAAVRHGQRAIAENGGETTSGEWRIAYVIAPAKSWHVREGTDYTVREPAPGETNHIEIIPFEASTGRIVPDVPIRLELLDTSGNVVQAQDLNFYYSDFVHYANNFSVPAPGRYTLRATLEAPTFLRHQHDGHGGPPALAQGTTVEFTDVEIDPGN